MTSTIYPDAVLLGGVGEADALSKINVTPDANVTGHGQSPGIGVGGCRVGRYPNVSINIKRCLGRGGSNTDVGTAQWYQGHIAAGIDRDEGYAGYVVDRKYGTGGDVVAYGKQLAR